MEILAGVVVAYDKDEGRAKIRMRSPLRRGDCVHIVGRRTNWRFALKAPRLRAPLTPPLSDGEHELDVLMPLVEVGDMVFRVDAEEIVVDRGQIWGKEIPLPVASLSS